MSVSAWPSLTASSDLRDLVGQASGEADPLGVTGRARVKVTLSVAPGAADASSVQAA